MGGGHQQQYLGYESGDDGMGMEQQSQAHQHQQHQHQHQHQRSWGSPPMKPPSSTSASAFHGGAASGGEGEFAMRHRQSFEDTVAYGSPGHHYHGDYAAPVPGGFNHFNSSGGYDRYATEKVAEYGRGGYMEESYEDEMMMTTESHNNGFNNPYPHHHNKSRFPSKPRHPNFQRNRYWAQKGV